MGTLHHRRSIRMKGNDYSGTSSYLVTVVSHERLPFFGIITDHQVILNELGTHVNTCWSSLPLHFLFLELDAFVVMPDHFHGILHMFCPHEYEHAPFPFNERSLSGNDVTTHDTGARSDQLHRPTPKELGAVIRSFKSAVTREAHRMRSDYPDKLWQRGYYESILRSKERLTAARVYIFDNPRLYDGGHPIHAVG